MKTIEKAIREINERITALLRAREALTSLSVKPTVRNISAAGRRRISQAQKARWAKRRAGK